MSPWRRILAGCLSIWVAACWLSASATPSWPDSSSPRYDSEFREASARWIPEGPDWRWQKAQGIQESGLRPDVCSGVGACGVMQVMPGTWQEIERAMGWRNVSRFSAHHNIFGGVYYQARMDRIWSGRGRSIAARHALGLGSYNAGPGSVLAAQAKCADALLWRDVAPCLAQVTGPANAAQTIGYVSNITRIRAALGVDLGADTPAARVAIRCAWREHRGGCGPNRSDPERREP